MIHFLFWLFFASLILGVIARLLDDREPPRPQPKPPRWQGPQPKPPPGGWALRKPSR